MSSTNNIRGSMTRRAKRYVVMTHREVAAELGISQTRVSQLERTALRKIKKEFEKIWRS